MLGAVITVLASASLGAQAAPSAGPSFKKVVVVMLENASYDEAVQQPFLLGLAQRGALLTNFSGETHPSQPNYIALVGGSTLGVKDDKPVTLDARSYADVLKDAGKTWKVYAQGYPGGCFLGAQQGRYARKHAPFLSFRSVQQDPAECANVVDGSTFRSDVSGGALPDFSLFIPDLDNDGHDTGVAAADQFLASYLGPLLDSWPADTLLVVTFDEDDKQHGNHVYAGLFGGGVAPGSTSAQSLNHYSVLKTVERALGTGSLGQNDDGASVIAGVWR